MKIIVSTRFATNQRLFKMELYNLVYSTEADPNLLRIINEQINFINITL